MKNSVVVVPYNPKWPELFAKEAEQIKKALGSNCAAIHHIGSTSVPGLMAKPVIDILPVVKDIEKVDQASEAMEALGYLAMGEYGIPFRRLFIKGGDVRTHNVHVFQEGNPEINRHLKFRDWLRTHSDDAKLYAKLKVELAKKFPDEIQSYCNGKDEFIASIDAKAGYNGYRFVKALTEREWRAVRDLRKRYFFKEKEDPFAWTFNHKDHVHFVFYKNSEIVGYVHLQLWPQKRAALRIIVIDERLRNRGLGGQFLKLCELWLKQQGFKELVTQSRPEAYKFYSDLGFVKMPFNDPEGGETHPRDIGLGKSLV
jgi:GrpB-like predicted nucleotidyltransferase (UPF0157 family)/GNAT superfamily N-acetyltransferase